MPVLRCAHLHQPTGWLSPGVLDVDDLGFIRAVRPDDGGVTADETLHGFVVPGVPNVHSHAFQRALAGFVQIAGADHRDSFWTWRTLMYRLAAELNPEDVEAIAAQLYVEMLEAGFTSVGEFHYLHHDKDGAPYADRAQMAHAVLAASQTAGLPLTVLPVAYFAGGFGVPAADHQQRFVHADVDDFIATWSATRNAAESTAFATVGVAPHSLRAVPPDALAAIVKTAEAADEVIHLHIAEQPREVEDCRAHLGQPPIAWLLANQPVGPAWCLVHATHGTAPEIDEVAAREATVGLCPTTEADLGDGTFAASRYAAAGGSWAVGTDSHARVSATAELRLLEWGQRLALGRRNVLGPASASVGRALFDAAVTGGARAIGAPVGALTPGHRADLVVLNPEHPRLLGHGPNTALDAWIFGGADDAVDEVRIAGRPVVTAGRHRQREPVRQRFAACLHKLDLG